MSLRNLIFWVLCFFQFNLLTAQAPANDNVCNATAVTIGPAGVVQTINTTLATVEPGETAITPPADSCNQHSWCEPTLDGTVWFTFTAPPSGNVLVSLCNSTYDTQLAVYEVGNCSDFNTYTLLDANDDTPDGIPGAECGPSDPNNPGYGISSEIPLACLVPGQTYYVLVDEFSSNPLTGGNLHLVITEQPTYNPIVVNGITIVQASCSNVNTGIATVNFTGDYPATIQWSTGATTPTATGIAAGTQVTVTVSNNCGVSDQATTTMTSQTTGAPLSIASLITTNSNCGQGYATVFATDGNPPYSYQWSNGSTSQNINLPPGPHSVTITDACTNTVVGNTQVSIGIYAGQDTTISGGSVTLGGNPTVDIPINSTLTTNIDQTIEGNIACRGGGFISDNEFYQAYDASTDFGIPGAIDLSEVEIGIFSATAGNGTGAQTVEARLYYINNLNLDVATMTLVSTSASLIPDISVPQYWRIGFPVTIPAGQLFAIGIWNPDGTTPADNQLSLGANTTAMSNGRETYISSNGCGITTPTPMSAIGFPHQTIINLIQTVPVTNSYTYNWSPSTDLNSSTVANPVCTPSQVGAVTYTVTVTDAQGCVLVDDVVVNNTVGCTGVTAITATDAVCNQSNGGADLNVSGVTPPLTFLWSNGETTEDITGLAPGNYAVTVTETSGCTYFDQVVIGSVNGQLSVYATSTPTGCDLNTGTATASAPFANSPVYTWNTGQTGATITGLAEGWYSVTAVDNPSGCFNHTNVYVASSTSCKVIINGNYINDAVNFDCIEDPTSIPLANRLVALDSNGVTVDMTFTDSTGYYKFVADTGTYEVVVAQWPVDSMLCPTTNSATVVAAFQGLIYTQDFYTTEVPLQDLSIFIISNPVRPGFTTNYYIKYCNDGSITMNGDVELNHESQMINFATSLTPVNYDATTSTAIWNYTNLLPGECRTIPFTLETPTTAQLGDIYHHTATVNPIPGDFSPWNNTITISQTVTGSYDPNDKQNLVGEDPFGGPVHPDISTYHYLIRFQNTGTDTAFSVVVTDTLSPKFDVNSIRIVDASHNYTADIDQGNILSFEFINIMLPDSNVNEPASHGHIYFTIDLVPGLPIGTEVSNTAHIYFDFNAPIVTNTVENSIELPLIVPKIPKQIFGLKLYPNPTDENTQLDLDISESATVDLQLFDVNGRLISILKTNELMREGSYKIPIRTADLSPGVYFLNLSSDKGFITRRIVKM